MSFFSQLDLLQSQTGSSETSQVAVVLGSKIPISAMPVWRASDSDTSDDDFPMGDDDSSEDLDVTDFTCQDQGLKPWC